jgi:hypothetical protein
MISFKDEALWYRNVKGTVKQRLNHAHPIVQDSLSEAGGEEEQAVRSMRKKKPHQAPETAFYERLRPEVNRRRHCKGRTYSGCDGTPLCEDKMKPGMGKRSNDPTRDHDKEPLIRPFP